MPPPEEVAPLVQSTTRQARVLIMGGLGILVLGAFYIGWQLFLTAPQPEASRPIVSQGVPTAKKVFLEVTYVGGPNTANNGSYTTLRVRDDNASTTKDLIQFSTKTPDVYPASQFTLHDNSLYFVDAAGQLMVIDSDLTHTRVVPIGLKPGEFVSSYLFHNDALYYLAGPYCVFYGGKCDSTLRVHDMKTQITGDILTHSPRWEVAGFNANYDHLYLITRWADAGAWSLVRTEVNLATKKSTDLPAFGGYPPRDVGDIDPTPYTPEEERISAAYDQSEKAAEDFRASLVPKIRIVNHLELDNSVLSVPATDPAYPDNSETDISVY